LEGWSIEGDVSSFTWESSGGNPGGFIHWVDAVTGIDSYWVGSADFLGNKSNYYGGLLSYDVEDTGSGYSGVPDVELVGDGITLVYVAGQAGTDWTHYSVSLAAAGWKVNGLSGAQATPEQMQDVLGDLSQLLIRAEYVVGAESGGLDNVTMTACFATGTRIATKRGDISVEDLRVGDVVLTASGPALPITWIGHRRVDCLRHSRPEQVWPVQVQAGAIAERLPERDLWLSPDHAVFLDGVLIPIKRLINGATIRQVEVKTVTYWHVELERHDILLAEGLPAESYLDTGNRAMFENGGASISLHPDFAATGRPGSWQETCAPLLRDDALLERIWRDLAARAALRGHPTQPVCVTQDPQLGLVAGERTMWPVSVEQRRYVFALPPGTAAVRLVSRVGRPTDVRPWAEDHRRLGVSVRRIVLSRQGQREEMPVDHPALVSGWYDAERQDGRLWRWTDGEAWLAFGSRVEMVEIELAGEAKYLTDEQERAMRPALRSASPAIVML
jgi:hypothetical protein